MVRYLATAFIVLGMILSQGFAAPSDSMIAGSTKLSNGLTMYFRLYVPRSYTPTKKYPIVVTLHGVGEKGTDNKIQVDHESIVRQWMMDSVQKKYAPFILCPQCPNSGSLMWSSNAADGSAGVPDSGVVKVLDSLKAVYSLDTTRFYIAGLSMGGSGTWALVKSFPQKFAAAVPCAGSMGLSSTVASLTPFASTILRTPYWSHHGINDASVAIVNDYKIDTVVRNTGSKVVYYTADSMMLHPTGITNDSLRKTVEAGALRLFSQVTNGTHTQGWMIAWYNPYLVPWVFSKSKVNGQTVVTWPAPGPASTTAVSAEHRVVSASCEKLHIANGVIRWTGGFGESVQLDVYSAGGRLVVSHKNLSATSPVSCASLPDGAYIAVVTEKNRVLDREYYRFMNVR